MIHFFKRYNLLFLVPLAVTLNYFAFENETIFWYMYTFGILVLTSIALAFGQVKEELRTWQSLLYGIGFGVLLYSVIAAGFHLLSLFPTGVAANVSGILNALAPDSIWHYLLLVFIIVPGEEIFWRGFVQQEMKKHVSPFVAIVLTSLLFGAGLAFSGFWSGALAGIAAGLLFGALYEWKRSMPALIIAHIVMLIFLFLVIPLPV